MSFGGEAVASGLALKKFETAGEIEEKRAKRQEEWEKIRQPHEPIEAPELPEDNRCLFDKLEEQRLKKQEEYEEQFKLKNQVKGLDEDESKFLDFVADRQIQLKQERKQEETEIFSQLKHDARVVRVEDTKSEEKKSKPALGTSQSNKRSQMALLAGAVKRKASDDTSSSKKRKSDEGMATSADDDEKVNEAAESSGAAVTTQTTDTPGSQDVARVIGVLPGLCQYEDSSDSESSSSLDSEPEFSLAGPAQISSSMKQIRSQLQHQ